MKKKICILGNSFSLLVWPSREGPNAKTYAEHLEKENWEVYNASKQGIMVRDVYCYLEDEVISRHPNHVLFQFGIVEATYRTRPRVFHKLFSNNNWNNSRINISYRSPIRRSAVRLLAQSYRYIERALFFFGIKWRYLPPKLFMDSLRNIILACQRQAGAVSYIIIGVPPISEKFEKIAPGTLQSVTKYNRIMKSIADEHQNVVFLDVADIFVGRDHNTISPDSIHLTALGHQLLSEKLLSLLNEVNPRKL